MASALREALVCAREAGELERLVAALGEEELSRRPAASAIAEAVWCMRAPLRGRGESDLYFALCGLAERLIGDARVAARRAVSPALVRMFRASIDGAGAEERDALMYSLRVLATLGAVEGGATIAAACVRAELSGLRNWKQVFRALEPGGASARLAASMLRESLPRGVAGAAFLELCNRRAGQNMRWVHAYASAEGVVRLAELLSRDDAGGVRHARIACGALPYLERDAGLRLLRLGMEHPDDGVRLEAACAGTRMRAPGCDGSLRRACLDVRTTARAKRMMEEIGRGDEVPPAARGEAFAAMGRVCEWLSREEEFGSAPDEIEAIGAPGGGTREGGLLFRVCYIGRGVLGGDLVRVARDSEGRCELVGSFAE